MTIAAVGATVLAAMVAVHPPLAAYSFLLLTPLIVGLDRGSVVPLLRPNEVLLLVLLLGLITRRAVEFLRGRRLRIAFKSVDASLLFLAFTGSVLPLAWMLARGQDITQDDLLYAAALWKYYAVFLMIRTSVQSERQVFCCLWLSIGIASILALLGIVQSLKLLGVPELLSIHYMPDYSPQAASSNRATVTFGSSLAMADFMIFNLAIAVGLLLRASGPRRLLIGFAILFAAGCFASGQVSGAVGLVVGVLTLGVMFGRLRTALLALLLFLAFAAVAFYPVVHARLAYTHTTTGLPISWHGRWKNLETYILPELVSAPNVLLGVRPAARVPAPETLADDWVYIESGYLWLLWTGGIPMLLAFLAFLRAGTRATTRVSRRAPNAVGVAAIASSTALVVLAVETLFDPHLTFRGTADLNFSLLALALITLRPVTLPTAAPALQPS